MLTHLSLCTGIGGIDLAAEWAGFKTIGQCEIDEYASRVLEKNFKGVHNFHDIRAITDRELREHGIGGCTVLSAGFPCQPYSLAGKGLGDGDERDLWGEVARCIGLVRPKWFVGENTPGLFARANQRYFRRIINDLSALGYSTSWGMWGACDVGAPHKRERVFIVAYSHGQRGLRIHQDFKKRCAKLHFQATQSKTPWEDIRTYKEIRGVFSLLKNTPSPYMRFARDDDGLSEGVDRLRCLGNAVVPYQIYPIFKAIAEIEGGLK